MGALLPNYSDLLFTSADGTQRFTHDTYQDYFLALAEFFQIQKSSANPDTISNSFSRLRSLSHPLYDKILIQILHEESSGYLEHPSTLFLDNLLHDYSSPDVFDILQRDSFLTEYLEITDMHSAGKDSPVLIHFNPILHTSKDAVEYQLLLCHFYSTREQKKPSHFNPFIHDVSEVSKYLCSFYQHMASRYGIHSFLTAGTDKGISSNRIVSLPTIYDELVQSSGGQFSIPSIASLELFLEATQSDVCGVSVECFNLLEHLAVLYGKRLIPGEFDSSSINHAYKSRAEEIINNSLTQLQGASHNKVALLNYFYEEECAQINPYSVISKGVSYVLLKPRRNLPLDVPVASDHVLSGVSGVIK